MLLIKKCIFFFIFFRSKKRLEIMFTNVLDRNETFFGHKIFSLSKTPKSNFFKGVSPCFWSKNVIFFFIFFPRNKTTKLIMFNNVLDRKQTFYGHKQFNLWESQKSHFSKGVNPCFWSKTLIFFFLFFRQNKTRNNVQ